MRSILYLIILVAGTFASTTPIISSFTDEEKIADAADLGRIRGVETQTRNTQRPFLKFLGIPYGYTQRFAKSNLTRGPLAEAGAVFEADRFGPPCPQTGVGEESCLFLNIATHDVKNISKENLRPVILFIHGAAFVSGNANAYTGELLLKRDVVVVSFNYRLGVFGFFCLNTEDAPCNAALYDALTALEWVQNYIVYFGGDPNSVTLAGQSSGSASVSHILLSPLADGLFHRAMALSGTALNEWALASDPMTASLRVAELSGCYDSSAGDPIDSELISIIGMCMKSVANQTDIINAQDIYQAAERKAGRLGFVAVNPAIQIQEGLVDTPIFLHDRPLNILTRGEQVNVPLVLGATKHDGAFGVVMLLAFHLIPNGNLQNDADFLKYKLVPTMLSSLGIEDSLGGLHETISRTYLGDTRMSGNFSLMLPGLIDMASVFYFKAGAYKNAALHSKINSTYFYSFDFVGTQTNHNPIIPVPGIAAHADDLIYVFPTTNSQFNEREQRMSDALIDYWVNFASTGKPRMYPEGSDGSVLQWPEFKEENPLYIILDDTIRVNDDYPSTWTSSWTPDPTPPPESTPTIETTTKSGADLPSQTALRIILTLLAVSARYRCQY